MSDNKFVDGLWANKPHENAPDFVKGEVSIDLKRFFEWAKEWKKSNADEKYLKLTIKESKKNEFYAEINDWKPQGQAEPQGQPQPTDDFEDSTIPF